MSTIGPLPTDSQPLTDKRSNPVWYRYFASLDRAMRAAITALGATVTTTRQIIAGAGLTGGGDLSADRTLDVGAGTGISVTADAVALDTTNSRNVDHSAVSISVGTGLTGGGTIAASRTIALANTAVTAAAYGGSGKRTAFTVDAQGRLTTASDAAITAAEITAGAALTASNDTNVTLTLGGTPATALLKATSITVAWSGTLAASRLNANVVQAIANDTNVTGSVATQTLTLGWTGTLAVSRGGTGAGTASGTALDNITGFASTGILVRTAAGTYAFRTLTGPAAGITVTNGNGVSGNPTFALANDLAALEALGSTGYAKRTGTDTWSQVTAIPNGDLANSAVTISGHSLSLGGSLSLTAADVGVGTGFFHVDRNGTDQTGLAVGFNKIQFTRENFDTDSYFDSTTNYRYTPLVAGKYFFHASIFCSHDATSTTPLVSIFKNGARTSDGSGFSTFSSNVATGGTSSVDAALDMNGTTDYIEFHIYCNTTSGSLSGVTYSTYAMGFRLRT